MSVAARVEDVSVETDLLLVRHGVTSHNLAGCWAGRTDSPFSALGRRQAELTARRLAEGFQVDRLYTSPLRRARGTAAILGRRLELRPIVHPGLVEMHFGEVDGMPDAEVRRRYPQQYALAITLTDMTFAWPGGESRQALTERVRQALREIAVDSEGQTAALVSHGAVFSVYLAELLEGDARAWPKYLLANCSLTWIRLAGGRPQVLALNDTSHLDGLPGPAIRPANARSIAEWLGQASAG